MNGGTILENLNELAYNNACCRCQYYIDKKCTNNHECIWKCLERHIKALEIMKEVCGVSWERILKVWLKIEKIDDKKYDLLKEVLL